MKTKILVPTHKIAKIKPYGDNELYFPMAIHNFERPGWLSDRNGEHMRTSVMPYYGHDSAVYWAWKNMTDVDAVGINVYRRYFARPNVNKLYSKKVPLARWFSSKNDLLLTKGDIDSLLSKYDCILPSKHGFATSVHTHFSKSGHDTRILNNAINLIYDKYPSYQKACDGILSRRDMHCYEVYIMKRPLFDKFCEFLFPLGEELEKTINFGSYKGYQIRCLGFVFERLLDVFIYGEGVSYTERPVLFLTSTDYRSVNIELKRN